MNLTDLDAPTTCAAVHCDRTATLLYCPSAPALLDLPTTHPARRIAAERTRISLVCGRCAVRLQLVYGGGVMGGDA